MTKEELISYEQGIAALFNDGAIRHPVHLAGGNEDQLIDIFSRINPQDWVFGQWRMHYHCLLKGVPPERLTAAIMQGRSIALCFPEYRIFSSAILGGHLPIALGVAMGIKRSGGDEKVWCFMGDMAQEGGAAYECVKYAESFSLPVEWVIEDNGLSVCTETGEVWGTFGPALEGENVTYYAYKLPWPHAGAGKRVQF